MNASDKLINLEGVQVGKSKRQCLQVINSSEATASPVFSLKQPVAGVILSPENPIKLNPNQSSTLKVTFSPTVVVKGIEQEVITNVNIVVSLQSCSNKSNIQGIYTS